ncbi:unnamed protein product [Brassica napus]|uniref:(rape) hypothetical protein n=1 Tax=Brassica napus TaxID=3708 RepID=A0A816XLY9_BRANA|nr:unnamed protein product [Brassica napus]
MKGSEDIMGRRTVAGKFTCAYEFVAPFPVLISSDGLMKKTYRLKILSQKHCRGAAAREKTQVTRTTTKRIKNKAQSSTAQTSRIKSFGQGLRILQEEAVEERLDETPEV